MMFCLSVVEWMAIFIILTIIAEGIGGIDGFHGIVIFCLRSLQTASTNVKPCVA